MTEREGDSDYQDAGEDSLAEHLKAVPPVVGRLVVCGYTATAQAVSRRFHERFHEPFVCSTNDTMIVPKGDSGGTSMSPATRNS